MSHIFLLITIVIILKYYFTTLVLFTIFFHVFFFSIPEGGQKISYDYKFCVNFAPRFLRYGHYIVLVYLIYLPCYTRFVIFHVCEHGRRKVNILGEAIRLKMRLYFFLSSSCLQWAVIKSQDQKKFPVLSIKIFSARDF
jgi:hypothetical protein